MTLLHDLASRRELIYNLTVRELKIRYRGSVLGFLWTLLIPLFMAGIYIVFLRLLAGRGVPMAEVIIGVFAWQFTVQSVNSGLHSVTGNANLVKKVYLPRIILPLSATLANLVNYLLSLLVQIPLILLLQTLDGGSMRGLILLLPAVVAVQFIFNLGLALLMASTNVYYRDMEHLVGVGLSAWFFLSPIMYNLSFLERVAVNMPWVHDLYMLNPLAVIVTAYRSLSLSGVFFPFSWSVGVSILIILGVFFGSLFLFQRMQRSFADLL
ncbi:MAG: ABC transporter permease [Kiritimatiellae bacterium]|nr:ABC transporter permease [Kiritimatiellia bacterium]